MNPTYTTKYENNGVIGLVTDAANLNIAPVNSGVIFDFINAGNNVGANTVHLALVDGKNKFDIAIAKNDNNINTTNDALLSATKLNRFTVTTCPILVYLNNAVN